MLKIVSHESENEERTIPMSEMKPLEVGWVADGKFSGNLVMRTAFSSHFEVMNLTRPGLSWTALAFARVKLLPKGEKATIELFNE